MNEIPFQLTGRQALRVTAEFLGFVLLISVGIAAGRHLLLQIGINVLPDELWTLVLANTLACAWVIIRTLRRHRVSWSLLAAWAFAPAGIIAPFLLLVLGTSIVLSDFNNLVEAWHPVPDWLRTAQGSGINFPIHPVASLVALAVVAPLTEESIFRGLILRGLLGAGSTTRALLLSAALFGLMHINP
ncbi:MAG: CPBP family intramembrane glutamic endopeptidase, partial [Opitutaceae bacterium]